MDDCLSIIIVTYNSAGEITPCLSSISKNVKFPHEIIVVDNNSADNSVGIIKKNFVDVNLIASQENLGFSKANNLGVEESKGNILLFLNPDTEIVGSAVDKMVEFLHNHKGIIAPKLIMNNGDPQPSVRRLPTLWGAISEYWLKHKNTYEAYVPIGTQPQLVESVVGAAVMIFRDLYQECGGFDEKYFMYFEDLDLCRKVRNKGFSIFYLPEAVIKHKIGSSAGSNPKTLSFLKKSARKYHGILEYFAITKVIRLSQLLHR